VSVWGGESIYNKLQEVLTAVLSPNRAVKFTVDLSIVRNDRSLIDEGELPAGKTFLYLTVLKKGTGSWSLKMKFSDNSTIEYFSDDLADGYLMDRRFVDILFTNSAQTVANPVLLVEWKE